MFAENADDIVASSVISDNLEADNPVDNEVIP
jgi:hypothetical protein